MLRNLKPPKTTAGGGFTFEDMVGAYYLAHLLADSPPLDPSLGTIHNIRFQTSVDGWYLDDILLELQEGTLNHRVAFSIKSNRQFTKSGAPTDFVKTIWMQYLEEDSKCSFSKNNDYLGLITKPLKVTMKDAIDGLFGKATNQDSKVLYERINKSNGWLNPAEKLLFQSLACPSDLQIEFGINDENTGEIIKRLQFLEFDFESTVSKDKNGAINICRSVLANGKLKEARKLWDKLLEITSQLRPHAGTISRQELLSQICSDFQIKGKPDYQEDWDRLIQHSCDSMSNINVAINGKINIDRSDVLDNFNNSMQQNKVVIFNGRSGVGKSALAKLWTQNRLKANNKVIWIDATALERETNYAAYKANLQLNNPLEKIIEDVTEPDCYLVIDGLDRIFNPNVFKIISIMLLSMRIDEQGSPWHVLITSRSDEMSRILVSLKVNNVHFNKWESVECTPINPNDLAPVWKEYRSLSNLQFIPKLLPIIANLKILDLIVRNSQDLEIDQAKKWVSEFSIANWFFKEVIKGKENGAERTLFVEKLAELHADNLLNSSSIADFTSQELSILDGLKSDSVCHSTDDDHIIFDHDLLGDWARLRILINKSSCLSDYLGKRSIAALWFRAIRLYGEYILESENGIIKFENIITELIEDNNVITTDLILESPIFAANPYELLIKSKSELFKEDGHFLKRMLNRFIMFATVPDPRIADFAKAKNRFNLKTEARYRIPNWIYWPALIQFLYNYKDEIIMLAPSQIGRIVELWLMNTDTGFYLRKETAEIGLMLAKNAYKSRNDYGTIFHPNRKLFYKVGIMGAEELHEDVSAFALRACEKLDPEKTKETPRNHPISLASYRPSIVLSTPWPNGPNQDVDDEFRNVICSGLDSPIYSLCRSNPSVAVEVLLAVLIKSPGEREIGGYHQNDLEIERLPELLPTSYIDGPFLKFLQINFEKGLDLIVRLVDFATDQLIVQSKQKNNPLDIITVTVDGKAKKYYGGFMSYSWSGGLHQGPQAVNAALVALEQYFYQQIKLKNDITKSVKKVLKTSKSTALLSLLINVGKKHQILFLDSLKQLLVVPEIYIWDISCVTSSSFSLMLGLSMRGQHINEIISQFQNQDHRKIILRLYVVSIYLDNPELQKYFHRYRQHWKKRLSNRIDDHYNDSVEWLILALDKNNFKIEKQQDDYYYVNTKISDISQKHSKFLSEINSRSYRDNYPIKCRQMFDDDNTDIKDANLFWKKLKQYANEFVAEDDNSSNAANKADIICGGISVLVKFKLDWLKKDKTRLAWCIEQLSNIISSPPQNRQFNSVESATNWTWDCFCAEILPILIKDDKDKEAIRILLAKVIWAPHNIAIEILFKNLAKIRIDFDNIFNQLRTLLFIRAHTQNRLNQLQYQITYDKKITSKTSKRIEKNVVDFVNKQLIEFSTGRLNPSFMSWGKCIYKPIEEEFLKVLHKSRHEQVFDKNIIHSAHKWVRNIDSFIDEDDRNNWINFWIQSLNYSLRWVDKIPAQEHASQLNIPIPTDFDYWVLSQVATLIQYLPLQKSPQDFWKKIFLLPHDAHYWEQHFLQSYHRYALNKSVMPPYYFNNLKEMFKYKLSEIPVSGKAIDYRLSREAVYLFGIDSLTREYWQDSHKTIVDSIHKLYEEFVEVVLVEDDWIRAFSLWLSKPVAESIIIDGIIWINKFLQDPSISPYLLRNEETTKSLASMLCDVWDNHQFDIQKRREVFIAFQNILRILAERHQKLALYLQGKISGLI